MYLLQNKILIEKRYAKELQYKSQNYMVLDGLLIKIIGPLGMEPYPVLCIPTSKFHTLLDYYHSSLFGNHSGIKNCFQTISQHFYCLNWQTICGHILPGVTYASYIKKGPSFNRPFQKRINLNVPAIEATLSY